MDSVTRATSSNPLAGIKVVDLTQVLAGPMATMTLGDHGAEVIKIEMTGRGDISRKWEPAPHYFDAVNRNKQSIAVDLKSDRGEEILRTLLADADVLVESMKPGRMETFNLDYESVRDFNPEIVYCSIKGFGEDSPYRDVPAMDAVVQAMSGIMSVTGEADGPPLWSGLPSGDLAPSMYATQSILAALYARQAGQIDSEHIEVSMFDCALAWMQVRAAYSFKFDEPFPRVGNRHPTAAPFGVFECADEPIFALASTPMLWERFCACLDRPDLLEDDRFTSNDQRIENREELRAEVEPDFAAEPADHWLDRFHENEVPAAPIYDTETVWEDEHVQQRGLRRTMERDDPHDARVVDNPVRFTNLETSLRLAPPQLGGDTEAVLRAHDYTDEEISSLRDSDVVE